MAAPQRIGFGVVWRQTHIHRWHMCSKTREQTVAEHLASVQFICLELMGGFNCEYPSHRGNLLEILYFALMHELDECVYGDATPQMKELSKYVAPAYGVEGWPVPTTTHFGMLIVELADKIDAFKFIREYGTGDYAREVQAGCLKSVKDILLIIEKCYPENSSTVYNGACRVLNKPEDPVLGPENEPRKQTAK